MPKSPTLFMDGMAEVYYDYPVDIDFEWDWQDLGFGRLVYCPIDAVKQLPRDYFALSVTMPKEKWLKYASFLGVTVLSREEATGYLSELCYSDFLVGGVRVAGQKVNLQVAWQGEKVKVGFPLIVGSF